MSAISSPVAGEDLATLDVSRPERFQQETWYEPFARLRREAPVHHVADTPVGDFWSVTTHRLIKEVDTNHDDFSSQLGGIAIADPPADGAEAERQVPIHSFISMDPPGHDRQRRTVAPSVAPGNLGNFEPLIRERVVDILEQLPVGEPFNWVQDVSVELTARMLATLFDFPYADRRKLIYWSDITTAVPQLTGDAGMADPARRQADLMECAGTFMELWSERAAAEPKFDLISMLAHGENTRDMNQDPMTFLGTVLLLIVGGNDTTRNSISGGVLALHEFPEEFAKLQDNPGLIPNMVAEIIRWQSPVIHMRRTAARDTLLGGRRIREGDKVVMWYISGNRDETVFEDADRFLIDRPNARSHVAFGYGIHRCMGNRLAEMQLRVLWEEILQRFERVEVAGPVERLPNNFVRGIARVPVILHRK